MREMIEALVLAVALARRIDQRQIARLALGIGRIALVGEIELLQRDGDLLGKADADEAAGCHRVAVADQHHRFGRRDDLAFLGIAQIGQSWMMAHGVPPDRSGSYAVVFVRRSYRGERAWNRLLLATRCVIKTVRVELSCVFRWRNRPTRL